MQSELTITCPQCSAVIKLSDTLAAPMLKKLEGDHQAKLAAIEQDMATREAVLLTKEREIQSARLSIAEQVGARLVEERAALVKIESEKARATFAAALAEQQAKVQAALDAQADLERQKRQLQDEKAEMRLAIEKQVQAEVESARAKATQDVENNYKLQLAERDEQIRGLRTTADELNRKAKQGSQQGQGEALERELEKGLHDVFRHDSFSPVPKGVQGGDIVQNVSGPSGVPCGVILWESKNTKTWSDAWLPKLKTYQLAIKADIAVIASTALPKGLEIFDLREGVWITHPQYAVPLTAVLRQSLIELSRVRQAHDGQDSKALQLYAYMSGTQFKGRLEAMRDFLHDSMSQLESEKETMRRLWAKREKLLEAAMANWARLGGELQGIAKGDFAYLDAVAEPRLALEPGRAGKDTGADSDKD